MISRGYKNEQEIRKRQIDTLKIFNANVSETIENEEYSVGFTSADRAIKINVYLGPGFPNDRPRLIVSPLINHHWIHGPTGEVTNAPGLVNFTVHSDLGRVVQAIIREFEKHPPPLWNEQTPPDQIQTNLGTGALHIHPIAPPPSTTETTIQELANLTLEELQQLDSDPQHMNDYVEELPTVQSLSDELDQMMTEIDELASENLTRRQHLIDLKNELKITYAEFFQLGESYEILNEKYLKKSEEYAPQHIKELLQIAASTSDTDCEHYVEQFLNNKIDIQTFLNCYMDAKKLSTARKAKEERLTQQLNALERAGF